MELTELTLEHVRRDLARMRSFAREVETELRSSPGHAHLEGRVVQLSNAPSAGEQLPNQTGELKSQLISLLADDKGHVGQGVDFSEGPPDKLPMDKGFYEQAGPIFVQVDGNGLPGRITVSSSVQTEIRESQVVNALAARVAAKDRRPSEILVVSCGLPDQRRYTCPVEAFIFQAILEAKTRSSGSLIQEPSTLRGVVLHCFGDTRLIEVYRAGAAAVPWPPAPGPSS